MVIVTTPSIQARLLVDSSAKAMSASEVVLPARVSHCAVFYMNLQRVNLSLPVRLPSHRIWISSLDAQSSWPFVSPIYMDRPVSLKEE